MSKVKSNMGAILKQVEDRIGHAFLQPQLLQDALTHPSFSAVSRKSNKAKAPISQYERLEFLGDRVLGLAVADMLWRKYPNEPEGDLALRFTAVVSQEPLAEVAVELGLDQAILLNAGTTKDNGRSNATILSDTCEAVLGALYQDAGFDVAKALIERLWAERILRNPTPKRDAKTSLQEWAQGRGLPLPKYSVLSQSGPSHAPTFEIEVVVQGQGTEVASGGAKRATEQAAAAAMLNRLTGNGAEKEQKE